MADADEERTTLLLDAVQEFVDRRDRGEIRSNYTYNKFKTILEMFK
jgi:hypothetical protein